MPDPTNLPNATEAPTPIPDSDPVRSAAIAEEQAALDEAERLRRATIAALDRDLNAAVDLRDGSAVARAERLRRRRAELAHASDGLIFGRVDTDAGAIHRIGRVGISRAVDEPAGSAAQTSGAQDEAPVVIDWRAPVARPFYTATPVERSGLRRRRQIRTEATLVTGVDDELLIGGAEDGAAHPELRDLDLVGEGALLAALGRRRTGRMGTAVATLQREQDEIVRADPTGPLIVQGGPGTGKTVVALHRVAYLLFSFPQVSAGGVLVLGPTERFLDYISQVLPGLGESAVLSRTIDALIPGVRAEREVGREVTEVQGRADWQRSVEAFAAELLPDPSTFPVVRLDGEDFRIPTGRIRRELGQAAADRPHAVARTLLIERIEEALVDAVVEHTEAMLVEVESGFEDILGRVDRSLADSDEIGSRTHQPGSDVDGSLSDQDLDRLRSRIADQDVVGSAVRAWWPERDPNQELRRLLAEDSTLARVAGWLTPDERSLVTEAAAAPGWSAAHLPLLDALAAGLGWRSAGDSSAMTSVATATAAEQVFTAERAAADPTWLYGHVVVDEAQDLSPMQWQMVRRRCPSRSITAVGDLDQAHAPHSATTWAEAVAGVLGARVRERELTICYRTPSEVMARTEPVLEAAGSHRRPPRAVRTSGVEPGEIIVPQGRGHPREADRSDAVSAVAADAADARLADALREAVGGAVHRLAQRWVGGNVGVVTAGRWLAALDGQVDAPVLPATQAKGLEWDAVVVVDPEAIAAEPRGWNRLYVAMTRCTQELVQVVVAAETP